MIEGKSKTNQERAKTWLYSYPQQCHQLLNLLTDTIIEYLVCQVQAGAQILQLFDSFAGVLSPHDFSEFSLQYICKIGTEVKKQTKSLGYDIPLVLFAKGAHYIYEMKDKLKMFEVLSLDWTMHPKTAFNQIKGEFCLQGNMDPCVLFADKEYIQKSTHAMLDSFGPNQPLIANLGHGMMPTHDPEHLKWYLEAIKSYK